MQVTRVHPDFSGWTRYSPEGFLVADTYRHTFKAAKGPSLSGKAAIWRYSDGITSLVIQYMLRKRPPWWLAEVYPPLRASTKHVVHVEDHRAVAQLEDGRWVYAIVYHDGGRDLFQYFDDKDQQLSPDIIFSILQQASQCVHALHQLRCIHRDLKLENFVIDDAGTVRLIDLESICRIGECPSDAMLTTERYRRPSVQYPREELDDWYAVGVMGYVMLLGAFPEDRTPSQRRRVIVKKLDAANFTHFKLRCFLLATMNLLHKPIRLQIHDAKVLSRQTRVHSSILCQWHDRLLSSDGGRVSIEDVESTVRDVLADESVSLADSRQLWGRLRQRLPPWNEDAYRLQQLLAAFLNIPQLKYIRSLCKDIMHPVKRRLSFSE